MSQICQGIGIFKQIVTQSRSEQVINGLGLALLYPMLVCWYVTIYESSVIVSHTMGDNVYSTGEIHTR